MTKTDDKRRVLAKGRFLTFIEEEGWEYVTRPGVTGIAVIVAITEDRRVVLVEQYRRAVHKRVIELPAGMVGDIEAHRAESMAEAAARELEEETGYAAAEMKLLFEGPIAVGISDEVISFFQAHRLTRVGEGGGDETEDITVHVVPLGELKAFLDAKLAEGLAVDAKIHTGLFLAGIAPSAE